MKNIDIKKIIPVVICLILVVVLATACKKEKTEFVTNTSTTTEAVSTTQEQASQTDEFEETVNSEGNTQIGQGSKTITLVVKDENRKETKYEVKSDKATILEALLEAKLISGTEKDYGYVVDTVTGIKADRASNNAYWAFYIGGEYTQDDFDSIKLVDGETYMFEYVKA